MLSKNASLGTNSGLGIFSPLYGRKTVDKLPQTVRRQSLMFGSCTFFPVFLLKKSSKNCRVEVWSNTSEFTQPPRLHGDAITNGTRKPRPIALSRSNTS